MGREQDPETSYLFCGGGTGGHVFMAVALAQELRERAPRVRLGFVGTPRDLEREILSPLEFQLNVLRIGGLNRVGYRQTLKTLFQLPLALWKSFQILSRFNPSVVVGLGGYSSAPVGLVAALTGRPLVLLEPNATPGLANRILAPFSKAIAVAFEETQTRMGNKARLTGIPVRAEFAFSKASVTPRARLRILVLGGSQGSSSLNRLVCNTLPLLTKHDLQIVHQTGPREVSKISSLYRKAGRKAEVVAFLNDMPQQFEKTDLVISRAGALTLAEITTSGKASILVPFPQAADDHQRLNAQVLVDRCAAIAIDQEKCLPEDLAQVISKLDSKRGQIRSMSEASLSIGRPDAAKAVVDLIESVQHHG